MIDRQSYEVRDGSPKISAATC